MCGITGFVETTGFNPEKARKTVERMGEAIRHRGPDHGGIWLDESAGVLLGHRRLSILDLSDAGNQPMISPSGRYVMVFNGEIYNHLDLRKKLGDIRKPVVTDSSETAAISWRGHSDTETLLAGFDEWGIAATVIESVGMFAFAVWDREERALTLGRDRIGEKPLYCGWQGETFMFASELKALKRHPSFRAEIDRDVLCLKMRRGYIPAPYSIYRGINKLLPGYILTLRPPARECRLLQYWSFEKIASESIHNPFTGSPEEGVDHLEHLLLLSIKNQMVADVPLGAFLSGGIDSSTIVALMQAQSTRKIKTFTIGFHESAYNEAEHALAVSKRLGTDHTELYVTHSDAIDIIPLLPLLYDEPFADSSQIPTFLVSRLARQSVTVSLSGDGGDELFCGYNRYAAAAKQWKLSENFPLWARRGANTVISSLPPAGWNRLSALHPFPKPRKHNAGTAIYTFAERLHHTADNFADYYHHYSSDWHFPEKLVVSTAEPSCNFMKDVKKQRHLSHLETMMSYDSQTYLPDDILVKVDRAAMGVSLETRIPLLDHRVVEFAWRLPLGMKIKNGERKWILRQVLYRYLPKEMMDRPKTGFKVPIGDWLKGPLRDWGENLLDESRLRREGFLNPAPIRQKWNEHLAGHRDNSQKLWNVLMFQAWLENSKKTDTR